MINWSPTRCGRVHDVVGSSLGCGFRCDQGMPTCEMHNIGQHTFVPAFQVGLGQPTTSLPEFAVGGQLMFGSCAQSRPLFEGGKS
jgi:hypothetical protein